MKKLTLIVLSALILASTAYAGGGVSDRAPGRNKDALGGFYSGTGSPTPGGSIKNLGGAISGGFYGNTANAGVDSDAPANGHGVTPSISPGPQTVGGDGPGSGTSVGEAITGN
mgnify:CR=1 FL=1